MRLPLRRPFVSLLLLCAVLAVLPGLVSAPQTYYTRTTGADSHSCVQAKTAETAKQTIAAGLKCLVGGDTLLIGAGTYPEQQLDIPAGSSESTRTIVRAEETGTVTIAPPGGAIPGGGEQYTFGFVSTPPKPTALG